MNAPCELTLRYRQYPSPKAKYTTFRLRMSKYGISKEEAILPDRKKITTLKYVINDEGRECIMCKKFKPRDEFGIRNGYCHDRNHVCKECKKKRDLISYYNRQLKEIDVDEIEIKKTVHIVVDKNSPKILDTADNIDVDKIKSVVNVKANNIPEITPEMCPGYVYEEEDLDLCDEIWTSN